MRQFASLVVIVLALSVPATDLFACGSKYLSVGRGQRFQRAYVSLHPSAVLVLKSNITGRKAFLSPLRKAGHRVTVIDDAAKLEATLKSGSFDVILADYENANMVEGTLRSLSEVPLFLPVIDAQSEVGKKGAKEYGCLLNPETPRKEKHFLATLDEAVDAALKARPIVCDIKDM